MRTLLIRGGTVVTATESYPADVLVRGERIAALGRDLAADNADVVDATGCFVLPGLIDPHVHIALDTGIFRTADDWRIGTATAALGGVTTVIDFATQFPGQDTRQAVAGRRREISGPGDVQAAASSDDAKPDCSPEPSPHIDYGLHCMLTVLPPDDDTLDRWMADLVADGVSAIKIYTTYRPNYYQDDATLLRSMRAAARAGLVVMVHAENDAIVSAATGQRVAAGETSLAYHGSARPALAEVEAVHRCLFLADQARCELYVVHCSVGRSAALIAAARQQGQRVHAETCPQYLLLDERRYAGADAWRYVMQPPLRDPYQPAHLWQLVSDGSISALGTDHCDYSIAQKLGFRPYRHPDLQPLLDALRPEHFKVLEARLGLFDGRPRTLVETARCLNLDMETVRVRDQEVLRLLTGHQGELEAALHELDGLDLLQEPPRLPFTQTPGGLPGLQTALPLLYTYGVAPGHLGWSDLVRLMSTNPARIFRIHPRKGNLAPGADADLAVYDPRGERTLTDAEQATVGGFTPYAGMAVAGRVRDTFVRGQAVVRDGVLVGPAGWGIYIPATS